MNRVGKTVMYQLGVIKMKNIDSYTKHYFTEGQRICSSISLGALANTGSTTTPISGTLIALQANAKKNVESTYIMSWNLFPTIITQDFSNKVASGIWDTNGLQLPPSVNPPASADAQFYYLSDHLGSSSYITNNIGNVTQTLAYLPFGEDWVNINNSTPYPPMTPYKFNGKEKDEETGFNYYGARYYWDWIPQFISIDPMSDKYPHLSSYAYCSNNPVMRIDPDGKADDWIENANGEIYWNDKATSQASTPKGEKYLGKEGYAVDENTGQAQHYQRDGTMRQAPIASGDIDISAKRPDHLNPYVVARNEGGYAFWRGVANVANAELAGAGTALTVIGYGSMLFGSGPIGAAIGELGVGLSNLSLGIDTGLKLSEGDYSGILINAGTYGVGRAAKAGLDKLGIKGQDAEILNRGIDIKTDIINRGANHIKNKNK